jgi:predicted kinase
MDDARARLLPGAAHTRADREVAYRAVLWTCGHLLRYTDIVICNGGFGHEEDREGCRAVARAAEAELRVVEFTGPLAVLLERNRARRATHPGLDLTDARVAEIVAAYPWTEGALRVDSTKPVAECVAMVRRYCLAEGKR